MCFGAEDRKKAYEERTNAAKEDKAAQAAAAEERMKAFEQRQREFASAKKKTIWPAGVNKYAKQEADSSLPTPTPVAPPASAEATPAASETAAPAVEEEEKEDTRPWDLGCLTKTAGPDAAPRQLGSIPTARVKVDVKKEIEKANAMIAEEKVRFESRHPVYLDPTISLVCS